MRISDWSSDVCSSDLFKLEDGEPVLTGRVDYRYRHRSTKIDQRGAQVASLAQETIKRRAKRGHAAFKLMPVRQSVFAELGEFSRSEEHTSELQSLMRISYAVFCLKKQTKITTETNTSNRS